MREEKQIKNKKWVYTCGGSTWKKTIRKKEQKNEH